jgi:chorismate dehydratase
MSKIKISAVSYLNTKPFIYGLQHSPVYAAIDLSLDTPADCAKKLMNNEADIGLVPVAAIKAMPDANIISKFCIGAKGAVGSVLLVSDVPLEQIRNIYLDYQSMTSVKLLGILVKNLWKINPTLIQGSPGYENKITGTSAGLIIGDRALLSKSNYNFVYDLASSWLELTGLPFVFACWVSNHKQDEIFIDQFENALAEGVSRIGELLSSQHELAVKFPGAFDYLSKNIQFDFDEEKKKALQMFLSMI